MCRPIPIRYRCGCGSSHEVRDTTWNRILVALGLYPCRPNPTTDHF